MQISINESLSSRAGFDLLILPCLQKGGKPCFSFQGKEFAEICDPVMRQGDFKGKAEETLLLYSSRGKEKRWLLLGLGSKEECSLEQVRRSFAAAVALCKKKHWTEISAVVPEGSSLEEPSLVKALIEGVGLAGYCFDKLKSEALVKEAPYKVKKLQLVGCSKKLLPPAQEAYSVVESVNFVRDLVNSNADEIHPHALAGIAKDLQKEFAKVKVTVLGKKELEKEKMGLILAVNRGASVDPAVIVLEYRGDPSSKDCTAIVGKGVTFDTGGLNLKPTGSIETMKCDMAGAGAVLGLVQAAARLGIRKNILGVIASAENAISANSYKPGDVYKSASGKTVEITNTDAEGRLVLADALTYVQRKHQPSRIIDLATLTGGIVIALGEEATGLFSNNDKLATALVEAGDRCFERVWRMPLYPEHKEALKSPIADMKNSAGRKASSCTGAMFLGQFIERDTPWAHLDIAGTAYLSETKPYHPTYATGVGVRLLLEFFSRLKT